MSKSLVNSVVSRTLSLKKKVRRNVSKLPAESPEKKVFRSFRVDMIEFLSLDLSSVSSPKACV